MRQRRWYRKPPEQRALELVRESEVQSRIRQTALRCGWKYYHTYDSRRSERGFPDTVLCKPPRLIFAECKTEEGKVEDEQREWLEILSEIPGVECYIWRPSDLPQIERLLSEPA